jgi:hypothetical protein
MNEPTTNSEAKVFLDARASLAARIAYLEKELVVAKDALGEKSKRRKAKGAKRAARVALGPGLKADGTARKVRGPNKKTVTPYQPKPPLATGLEKSEQG